MVIALRNTFSLVYSNYYKVERERERERERREEKHR